MNIADILIRLRDDLKDWATHNMLALQALIPTKISELENDKNYIDEDYITEMQLTLGVHADGLIYLFKNGEPVGTGIKIGDDATEIINLMNIGEIYLNQRFSSSGGGLVSDEKAVGMFALIVPFATDGNTIHTLKFNNLVTALNTHGSTLYFYDADGSNIKYVNGSTDFDTMTEGVTISDISSAEVTFTVSATKKYMAISLIVKNTEITLDDIADYVITLD